MALSDDRLAAIRSRVAETTTAYTALGSTPSQMAQDREHLLTEVERLDAELARRDHADVEDLVDQVKVRGLTVGPQGVALDMEPPHELVDAMVEQAKRILGDAPNYTETPVTLTMKAAGEVQRYAFTVQRVGNLTPHQAREKAEAEVERLTAERDSAARAAADLGKANDAATDVINQALAAHREHGSQAGMQILLDHMAAVEGA